VVGYERVKVGGSKRGLFYWSGGEEHFLVNSDRMNGTIHAVSGRSSFSFGTL